MRVSLSLSFKSLTLSLLNCEFVIGWCLIESLLFSFINIMLFAFCLFFFCLFEFGFILSVGVGVCWCCVTCDGEILIVFWCNMYCNCEIFWLAADSYNWGQWAWGIETCACLLSGVGVDGHIGSGNTISTLDVWLALCIMCTWPG